MENRTRKARYQDAIANVETAILELQNIRSDYPDDYDSSHFTEQLEDVLSCDHGECGLKVYVDRCIRD